MAMTMSMCPMPAEATAAAAEDSEVDSRETRCRLVLGAVGRVLRWAWEEAERTVPMMRWLGRRR